MKRGCGIAIVAPMILAVLGSGSAPAQPKTPAIVDRATQYVDEYVRLFSNVVAEERYVQEIQNSHQRREIVSDFLLVTAPGAAGRYQFRDTLEVDGKPVRDRDNRLARLFLEAPANALQRAREINAESERYNLRYVSSLNQPLVAIAFLQSIYKDHFRYAVGRFDRDSGPSVRLVGFEEWQRPTIIRNLAARGRFLIDESTGRVLRTELEIGRGFPPPSLVTTFRFDDELQLMVPNEMREPYGVATYSRFRRFTVRTDESIR